MSIVITISLTKNHLKKAPTIENSHHNTKLRVNKEKNLLRKKKKVKFNPNKKSIRKTY